MHLFRLQENYVSKTIPVAYQQSALLGYDIFQSRIWKKNLRTRIYLAFKWTKPSAEHDVSWKKIDLPGVGIFFDCIMSSKKLIWNVRYASSLIDFEWKHCFAFSTLGVRSIHPIIVTTMQQANATKNVRPVSRSLAKICKGRNIFCSLTKVSLEECKSEMFYLRVEVR